MRKVQEQLFPPPVAGLIRQGTLMGSGATGAEVLDNFIPTAEGCRLRGGAVLFATVASAVKSLLIYRSGSVERLFAATTTTISNITSVVDPLVPPATDLTGLGSGDWSQTQFATPGGQFLVIANGVATVRNYNGTAWSVPAITGPSASSVLNFVWAHKKRLWFVENGRLSAWYLPVNSIAGAAVEFPLDGVFSLGGNLLFGGTYSQDSGSGLDDYAVFVSSSGEVAIYQGTDPASASTWALVGVYRIGKPLGKNAWFRAGGDLVIMTEDGIVPVSGAMNKDMAALQVAALTAPIEQLWQQAVAGRSAAFPFSIAAWPTKTLLVVAVPRPDGGESAFVANTRTGAWARLTGWDIQCQTIFRDGLFYGDATGRIAQADTSGSDFGLPYAGYYVPKMQEFGQTGDKVALHARVMWRERGLNAPRLGCFQNYNITQYPTPANSVAETVGVWGISVWGTAVWSSLENYVFKSEWQAVSGFGFSLAPVLVVGSNRVSPPDFELVGMALRYEVARSM
jgi:hypothetical protein